MDQGGSFTEARKSAIGAGTSVHDSSRDTSTTENRFRILVVDDEAPIRELLIEILGSSGYEVHSLGSPVEALSRAKRQKFDALILDLYMPEMSGMLFHAKLRVFDPELAGRTIFVSGYISREELRKHLAATPTFLEKPFQSMELLQMVQQSLPTVPRRSNSS